MRCLSTFAAFLMLIGLALPLAAADPTTQPVAPATQPMASDVYLVPFAPLGGDNSLDWAGKAVQQNLLTDLARARLNVIPADKPIENTADAQTAATAAGAKFIITGTYQVADTLVRFTGQLMETATGKIIGGLSATGAPRDLFSMEDVLSAQAIQLLTHPALAAVNPKPPGPVPAALAPAVVVQIVQPPAVGQTGSSSSYDGSALQAYVDANRTPSTDFNQQVQDSQDRNTYDYGYNNTYLGDYSYGVGYGYGFGFSGIYSISPGGYRHGPGHQWNDGR